ncbi:hypothetical protein NG798_12130 [Ancylothrix sp. C2]|uniref:DUF6671 family protein n=1 Tax=Ancylothrix sp. D3o TaxID=2953691 RepID=UPI0021BB72D6|nr:DUF6671 family protein [Ancylothrix sp. D3o]MCT7950540.1 hypothetical protein [Ancylothrix sp. D3o]
MTSLSLFKNRTAVIATMHKKEQAIAPLVEQELLLKTVIPDNFNTDLFGTFSRDVKRRGTQIEAARAKAEKAMEITGTSLGIASEGSFGPHPAIPFLPHNREIVLFLDKENNLEIIGEEFTTDTNYSHELVNNLEEAEKFAKKAGFPEHGLVVIIGESATGQGEIIKGIITPENLSDAVNYALKKSAGAVHIETDMRAMYNPTRMRAIERATRNLIEKIKTVCPQCSCPGFEIIERKKGLPCSLCNLPTHLTKSVVYQCKKCEFCQEKLFPDGIKTADPGMCQYCNP